MLPQSHHADIELDDFASSSARPHGASQTEAAEPLLSRTQSPSSSSARPAPSSEDTLNGTALQWPFSILPRRIRERMIITMGNFEDSTAGRLLQKLEVNNEAGLTNAQMFLTNHDLKPVEEARRKWGGWNFVGELSPPVSLQSGFGLTDALSVLGCRLVQHQHLDDRIFHDHPERPRVVASLAVRLDRLLHCRLLHLHDRPDRCHIPYPLPGGCAIILWHLGFAMAGLQPRSNGLHLVWCTGLDRRDLHGLDASSCLALVL